MIEHERDYEKEHEKEVERMGESTWGESDNME